MTKLEQVIYGLDCCSWGIKCSFCPYKDEPECKTVLMCDALNLLKEQEQKNEIEPKRETGFWIDHKVWIDYENNIQETVRCSLCNNLMEVKYTKNYCSNCGAKMEENKND